MNFATVRPLPRCLSSDAAEPDTEAANEQVSSREASSASEATMRRASDGTPQPRQLDGEPAARDDVKLVLSGLTLDEITLVNSPLLPYLAMVASVLEHRTISVSAHQHHGD